MNTNLAVAFAPQIAAAAARHHLDPRLLAAVAAQETGGPGSDSGRNVVGDGGHGRGVFQIDDRWHAFARGPGAMDPAQNADYAAGLLASHLDRYGGDVRAALSTYNAGTPSATGTRTTWADGRTLGYADSVLRHYERLGGSDTLPPPSPGAASGPTSTSAGAPDAGGLLGLLQLLQDALAPAPPAATPLPVRTALPAIDQHDVRDLAPDAAAPAGDVA